MNKYLMIIAPLALAGCGYIPGTDAYTIKQAQELFKQSAHDADKMKFRNERVADTNVGLLVCGENNGVNQMGAYIGWSRYLSTPHNQSFTREADIQPSEYEQSGLGKGDAKFKGMDPCESSMAVAAEYPVFQEGADRICHEYKENEVKKAESAGFVKTWDAVCGKD